MAANSLDSLSDVLHSHLTKRGGVMYVPSYVSASDKNAVPTGRHTFEEYISVLENFEYAYRLYMENMYCKRITMKSSDHNVNNKVFSFEDISHAFGLPDFEINGDKQFSFLGLYAPFVSKVFSEYNGDYWSTYVNDRGLSESPQTISEEDESIIVDEIESIKDAISGFVNSTMYQYPNDISTTISDKSIEEINNLLEAIHDRLVGNLQYSGSSIFDFLKDYYASGKICEYLLRSIDEISEKYLELVEYKRRLVFSKGLANNYPETINFFKLFYVNSIISSLNSPEELSKFFKVTRSNKDNSFANYCKSITFDIRDKYAYCIPKDKLDVILENNKNDIINSVKNKIIDNYELNTSVEEFFNYPTNNNKVNIQTFENVSEEELESLYDKINGLDDNENGFYTGYSLIASYIKHFQNSDPKQLILYNDYIELAIGALFEKKYYRNYLLDEEMNSFSFKKGIIQSNSPILSTFLDNGLYLKPDNFNFVSFSPEEQKDCDLFFQYKEQIRTNIFYRNMKEEFKNFQVLINNELDVIIDDLLYELKCRGITYEESKEDIIKAIREKINSELLITITNVNNDKLNDAISKVRRAVTYGFTRLGTPLPVMNDVLNTCSVNNNIDNLASRLGEGIDQVIKNLYQKFDGPFLFKRMIDSDMMMKYIKANFTSLPQFNYARIAIKSKEIAKVTRSFMNEPILRPTNGKICRGFEKDSVTGEVIANTETLGDRIVENIPRGLLATILRNLGVSTYRDVAETAKHMINNNNNFINQFLTELNNLDFNPPRKVYSLAHNLGYREGSTIADLDKMINFISKSEDLGFFYQISTTNGLLLCYFEPIDELHTEYQLKHIFTDISSVGRTDVYAKDNAGAYNHESLNGIGNAVVSYNYKRVGGYPVIQNYFSVLSYFPNTFPTLTGSDMEKLKVLLSGDNIPCFIKKIESTEGLKLSLAEAKDFADLSVQMD